MTDKEQLPSAAAPTPFTAETLAAEASQYFSEETCELFGSDTLSGLLSARARLVAGVERDRTLEDRLSGTVVKNETHVAEFMDRVPGQARLYELIANYAAARMDAVKPSPVLMGLSTMIYQAYTVDKHDFITLDNEKVVEDLQWLQSLVDNANALYTDLDALFEAYNDNDADMLTKSDIEAQIIEKILAVRYPSQKISSNFQAFLLTNVVMNKLRVLETMTEDRNTIIKRLSYDHLVSVPSEAPVSPHRFRLANACQQYNQFRNIIQEQEAILDSKTKEALLQYSTILQDVREAQVKEMNDQVVRALQTASEALFGSLEADAANEEYAQSLLDCFGVELQPNAMASSELPLLTQTKQLNNLLREMEKFTAIEGRNIKSRQQPPAEWQGMFESWGQRLDKARETAQDLLARRLDDLMQTANPLVNIWQGSKPRRAKKQRDRTPEQLQERQTYDKLHRAGFADDKEKSMVMAVIDGRWDELQRLRSESLASYQRVADFAESIDCSSFVAAHRLTEVLQLSHDQILQKVQRTVRRLGASSLSQILTTDQRDLLQQALADASEELE